MLAGILLAMLADVVAVHAVLQAAVYGMDIIAKLVGVCQRYRVKSDGRHSGEWHSDGWHRGGWHRGGWHRGGWYRGGWQ